MADDFGKASSRPNIVWDTVDVHDGVALDEPAVVQNLQLVSVDGTESAKAGVPGNPFLVGDASPPLVQLSAGGQDVVAGTAVTALAATAGRVKGLIQHTGTSGVLWVRFDGAAAAVGVGEALYPGQQWSEWTASAVSVYFQGTGTCPVATSELGA